MEADAALAVDGVKVTKGSPPRDLAEVDERIEELRKELQATEGRMTEQSNQAVDTFRDEIGRLRGEVEERDADLEDRVEKQATKALRERKTEGLIFALGVLLQLVGAAFVLVSM